MAALGRRANSFPALHALCSAVNTRGSAGRLPCSRPRAALPRRVLRGPAPGGGAGGGGAGGGSDVVGEAHT